MAHYLDKDGLLRFFQGLKNVFAAKNHSHTTVNGHTVNADVPSGAKFTDTVYTHPSYTARTGKPTANATPGFGGSVTVSQITSDATGHVTGATDRTITIPSTAASQSAAGLMSAADKKAVDDVPKYYRGLQGGTAIAASTDLNTLTTPGNYYCSNSSTAQSLTHSPTTTWFYMFVSLNDGYSTAWPSQEIVEGTTGKRYYRYKNGSNDWVAWTTLTTRVKGSAESSYRSGDVNLTAANIGAAAASHTHSPDQLTAGYIRNAVYISHHPEGDGKATFPFLYNDLAHLVRRGGAYTVYTTTATDYTPGTLASTAVSIDLTNAFDGSPSYIGPNRAKTDKLVIDITCPQMFTYSNVFYLDFGSDIWRAKSINVLVMNANTETKYTQKAAVTNWAWGHYQVPGLSHKSTNTSGTTVQGFNRLRIVLTDFANTQNRIAQIGIINYGSQGVRLPYMSRGVDDDVYRSIHPAASGTYSLGTSSKKWADGYFTTLYGSGANLTSLNASNLGSGTVPAARLPAASTTAQGAMSADDKKKLDGIAAGANAYTHPSYTAKSSGLYKVTVDSTGHVSGTAAVAKADITALGIPAQDTTYSSKTAASGGTDVSLVTTGEKYTWNSKTNTRVKGNAESSYRTGDVNLTAANIGAAAATHYHAAGDVTSGTFDAARIPSLAAGKITSGTFDAARIPSLNASKIGSGTLAAARLPAMTGATASAAGTQGAVPAPAAGKQAQFLRGDGTWATPTDTNTDTKVNVTLATTTKAFLLGTSTTPTTSAKGVTALADTGVYLDTTAGRLTATSFAGNGLLLTNLDAGNLYAGTVPRARLPLASSTQAGAMSAGDKAKLDSIIVTGANSVYLFKFSFAQNTFDSQQSLLYQVEDDDVGFDSTWLPEIIVPPQAGTYSSYASSLKGPIKVTTQADNVLWFQSSYPLLSSLTLWIKLTKTYQSNITEQELSA